MFIDFVIVYRFCGTLVWFHTFSYFYAYRFPFISVPELIDGNTLTATVVDLNAWVEYEFRVLAKNSVGVGEPSPVSVKTRTEDAGTLTTITLSLPSNN